MENAAIYWVKVCTGIFRKVATEKTIHNYYTLLASMKVKEKLQFCRRII